MSAAADPREVGRLLVAGFEGTEPSAEVLALIREERLGGVILYAKNCAEPRQVLALTNRLQEEARAAGHGRPLLVAIDQEQGRVARLREGVTLFPAMGEIARAGDPVLVERVAEAVSRELLAVGVNWNLAPVADVLSAPGCPVGDRSFGADPAAVAAMAAAFVRGAARAGMLTCAKHFPGHGATGKDSHVAAPVVGRTRGQLEACDLVPFRAAVAAGADAVMTTHITFPALDPARPASLSRPVIDGLLRGGLGFRGAVVSDDLEMAGVAGAGTLGENALAALAAGTDLFIVSGMLLASRDVPGVLAELRQALRGGALPAAVLDAALARADRLRERLAWRRDPAALAGALRAPSHLALLDEVARRAGA